MNKFGFDFFRQSKRHVRIYTSRSDRIYFNLAAEKYLLSEMENSAASRNEVYTPTLFLWQNNPTIVIGRHQNAYKECDIEKVKRDKIDLCRRSTGGGAVYQDMGNTCFAFLMPNNLYDKSSNSEIIISALKNDFNIDGNASGKNDLVVDGKKFSGAAFFKGNNVSLHHGTLLRNVDLNLMQAYLNPSKLKLHAKGVASIRSRVTNLIEINREITHDSLCNAIARSFHSKYGHDEAIDVVHLSNNHNMTNSKMFFDYYNKLCDKEWQLGCVTNTDFSVENRFDWATFEINFSISHGIVSEFEMFSDTILDKMVDAVVACIKTYTPLCNQIDAILLDKIDEEIKAQHGAELCELISWISRTVLSKVQ